MWRQRILYLEILLQPVSWVTEKDFGCEWDLGSSARRPAPWANDTDSWD